MTELDQVSIYTPTQAGARQYRYCARCSTVYLANQGGCDQDLCAACRKAESAPLPRPRRYTRTRWEKDAVVITRDPLPLSEGGFSPGAAFEIDEFAGMLEAGCLAVGTAFTYHGQAYTVTGHNLARREDGRRFYGASLALRPVRA